MKAIGTAPAKGRIASSLLRFLNPSQHPFIAGAITALAADAVFVGLLMVLP